MCPKPLSKADNLPVFSQPTCILITINGIIGTGPRNLVSALLDGTIAIRCVAVYYPASEQE